jgi:hypothetical protein
MMMMMMMMVVVGDDEDDWPSRTREAAATVSTPPRRDPSWPGNQPYVMPAGLGERVVRTPHPVQRGCAVRAHGASCIRKAPSILLCVVLRGIVMIVWRA